MDHLTPNSKIKMKKLNHSKNMSLSSYLLSELQRGYMLENDEERYSERRDKVETFFMIPRETEKFFAYGFFQCADSFTFVLTFLPIRFILAILALIVRSFAKIIRYSSGNEKLLKPAEAVDIMKGLLLIICCYLMTWFDTSVLYHLIKTQSTIKIYLIFNMLEIADRLMSAFGQDTLDALFWTGTEPVARKRQRLPGLFIHMTVSVLSVLLHSCIILLQALALNVAINASDKGLLAILISNNFVELKGSVFKKFDRINLLQIACSDIRERFHLIALMVIVALQTLKEYNWSEERLYILLPDFLLIGFTELFVDWIKHAFVTRFNDIPIEAYRDYTVILAHDLVMCKQKYADSDHSDLVARRMGFIPLPLAVITFRILYQCIPFHNGMSYVLLAFAFAVILSFRVLNGILMLGKAGDVIQEAERRRDELASSETPNGKNNSNDSVNNKTNSSLKNKSSSFYRKTATDIKEEFNFSDIEVKREEPSFDLHTSTPSKSAKCETPFSTPSHSLVKRVRLHSGAEVQEIEPYYHYYQLSDSANDAQNGMSLSLDTEISSNLETPSSGGEDSSIDFRPNPQASLMTNSMVNLASVGINQGPQTPGTEDSCQKFPPSRSSSCFSLPEDCEEPTFEQLTDLTSSFTSTCSDQVKPPSKSVSPTFKSVSAPDVRNLLTEEQLLQLDSQHS